MEFKLDKGQMQAYAARNLHRNDIVLVETHICRYVASSAGASGNTWDAWCIKLKLLAITLVHKSISGDADKQQGTSADPKENIVI